MSTLNHVYILKVVDLRKELAGFPGEGVAVNACETKECQCCGRKIKKLHHMASGHVLGSECAYWLAVPAYRMGRPPGKKLAAFARSVGVVA
jgi:hypothetical protein